MEKILGWITDISLLVFGIIFLTLSFVALNNYKFDNDVIQSYTLNWSKGPILDIIVSDSANCIPGYEPFISNVFPGHTEGCNCLHAVNQGFSGKIYQEKCTEVNIVYGCQMIFRTSPITLSVWKGKTLCVSRMKRTFWELESNSSNNCKIGLKKCGVLDTTGNFLCREPEQTCPINKIEILPKGSQPSYPASKIELEGANDLYFTNTFTEGMIVTEFIASSGPICVHPFEGLLGMNSYMLNTLKGKNECSTPINNELSDPRFKILDTERLSKFYEDNQIDQVINNSPGYPIGDLDISVKIFEINYFGWNKRCHNIKEFTPELLIHPLEQIYLNNKRTYGFAIVCTIQFVVVVGTILLYKILIARLSTNYLITLVFEGINFCFIIIIFIYSIVIINATSKLLIPFYHFIYLNCGDEITNNVLKFTFSGITSVNTYLIPICFFSGLEIGYLLFFYIFTFIRKNSRGYMEINERSD